MCKAFPQRRSGLDAYERDMVDMTSRYPGTEFYEYHIRFSAAATAHLRYNNIAVYWSIRNNTMFCNIFPNIGPNPCENCSCTFHTTDFCIESSILKYLQFKTEKHDVHDRDRILKWKTKFV